MWKAYIHVGLHPIHLWNIWFKIYDMYILLETNMSHPSRHFWVDDFPNFPRWSGICDRSLEGTDNTKNSRFVRFEKVSDLDWVDWACQGLV